MSFLLRAAVLGGLAYFAVKALRKQQALHNYDQGEASLMPMPEQEEAHVWPTSSTERAPTTAGPTS